MSEIQFFDNGEFELRIIPDRDSFRVAAPSLARDLGFKDAHDLVRGLPENEKGSELVRTPGGDQHVLCVTEPGFYRVIGQRQVARIKDERIRDQVARFQNWVYGDVLPTIRRTGAYGLGIGAFTPTTWSWDETCVVIRQRYGIRLSVIELRRVLRAAGVLRQSGDPKSRYQDLFWFTGSAWEVLPQAVPQLVRRYEDTAGALTGHSQARLDVTGHEQLTTDSVAEVIELRTPS